MVDLFLSLLLRSATFLVLFQYNSDMKKGVGHICSQSEGTWISKHFLGGSDPKAPRPSTLQQ